MKKILVIEDENSVRTIVRTVLEVEGYTCHEARNGAEGLTAARQLLPDLIVSDVMMPLLDGFGVLLELQNDPKTAVIPFIFLTGQTDKKDLRRGMSLGADDYLFKPFTPNELITAVRQRLNKHELLFSAASGQAEELKVYLNTTLPHELRTPLTGIIGYLDMLLKDYDNFDEKSVKEMIRRMSLSAGRLYRLVENYLTFANMNMTQQDSQLVERLRTHAKCTTTQDIIMRSAEKTANAHKRLKDLSILDVDDAPLAIFCENLSMVVSEVIDNALKFSQPDTPILIKGAVSEKDYFISVADQGRGMTAEQIATIGENRQFNRAQFEQQGVGLGLMIAQQTCSIFGGQLHIRPNTPAAGITVTAKLPLRA